MVLDVARDVAQRFNARFGETFTIPEGIYPEVGARIMDLQEPTKKMSTTGGTPPGTGLLLDPPDVIRHKVLRAVTDARSEVCHDPDRQPGVSNLLEILAACTGGSPAALAGAVRGYGGLEAPVGDALLLQTCDGCARPGTDVGLG